MKTGTRCSHKPKPRRRTALRTPIVGPAPSLPIRLLVVDDHPAVRLGVRQLLEDQPDFKVAGVVEIAEGALVVAERQPIDVAIVDYRLGGRNGLWVGRELKRLREPPQVVIYSAYASGHLAASCVIAEADGLVSEGGPGLELCDAIRSVARGMCHLPRVPSALADLLRQRLDSKEQAIFGMLLAGIPRLEIAQALGSSTACFESHGAAMLRKLEALPGRSSISRVREAARASKPVSRSKHSPPGASVQVSPSLRTRR